MAWITKDEVKEIRDNLKKAFPKMKFSVRKNGHSSTVHVSIMESPFDFTYTFKGYNDEMYTKSEHYEINTYHLENSNYPHLATLKKISAIALKNHWDKSDMQTDYFNCAFYFTLEVGQWNKPYKQTAKAA